MEITLKDGSGWSNWKESFPNKLVDEVLIVFNLESDRLESINDYCLQEKIQSEAVHTDCTRRFLKPNLEVQGSQGYLLRI